jgi:NADH:ubiquinone oxidoreductase subunit B-like Fe-S oxidoreductase
MSCLKCMNNGLKSKNSENKKHAHLLFSCSSISFIYTHVTIFYKLIVVQGTVNRKMAPRLRRVYDQMLDPKYVIVMEACAITGGLYVD